MTDVNANPSVVTRLPGRKNKPFDVFGFVIRRIGFILFFGTLIFLAFLPLLMLEKPPITYTADGRITVQPEIAPLIDKSNNQSISRYFDDYVRTQSRLIKNHEFIKEVLSGMEPANWPSFIPPGLSLEKAAWMVTAKLGVDGERGTQFIVLQLEGPGPEGLAELINKAMERFVEMKEEEQFALTGKRMEYLKRQQQEVETELARQEVLLEEAAVAAKTSTFDEMFNIGFSKLQDFQQQLIQARVGRIDAESRYNATSNRVEAIRKISIQTLADEITANDQSLWGIQNWTYQTLQELRSQIDGIAEGNPDRKYVEVRMDAITDYLTEFRGTVEDRNFRIVNDKREYELKKDMLNAKLEYDAALELEKKVEELLETASVESARISTLIRKGDRAKFNVENLRDRLEVLNDRIQELHAEANSPTRMQVSVLANRPRNPSMVASSRKYFLLFAFAYGFIGILYAAYDFLDNRIRSYRDVRNAMGAPVPDAVVRVADDHDFSRVALVAPGSRAAAAIRSLAIRLDNERRNHQSRIFLFSGINAQSGVSQVLLNTACSLRGLTNRVLVVDCNFVAPGLAPLVGGLDSEYPCFADYVEGKSELSECLVRDPERDVDLLLARRLNWQTMDAGRIRELFDMMAERYDMVLIDTPPLTASEITEYLLHRADAAVLVVQEDRSMYRTLRWAMYKVAEAEIDAITIVLNFASNRNVAGAILQGLQQTINMISEMAHVLMRQAAASREETRGLPLHKRVKPAVKHVRPALKELLSILKKGL